MDIKVANTSIIFVSILALLFAIVIYVTCRDKEVKFPDDKTDIKSFRWPKGVTRVIFPESFNQPIDNLPNSVTYLEVGDDFDSHIIFPKNLKHFVVGHNYNYPIDGLPNGVKKLEFGFYFNQPLDNIPPTVEEVVVGNRFTQPVNNIPPSVRIFKVLDKSRFKSIIKNGLYKNTSIWFDRPIKTFPPTVKYIQVGPYKLKDIKRRY